MNLNIINRGTIIPVTPAPIQTVELLIDFPTEIVLDISGKNMNCDTILDENGSIIKDKHIELIKVVVDHVNVREFYLRKLAELDGNNTTYFGFNGMGKLKFSEENSFIFLLKSL
jgi:hypothetical protein